MWNDIEAWRMIAAFFFLLSIGYGVYLHIAMKTVESLQFLARSKHAENQRYRDTFGELEDEELYAESTQ